MAAKFLDDNKAKTSLKKWIHTVSNFIDLTQFHLICKILAKEPYLSLVKEKENSCVVFTYSIKPSCEIRKFQVLLTNVQKSVNARAKLLFC